MSKINDGGPAYPGGLYEPQNGGSNDREPYNNGMSLRDWFAGQALGSRAWASNETPARIADWAYAYADAMLAERARAEGR